MTSTSLPVSTDSLTTSAEPFPASGQLSFVPAALPVRERPLTLAELVDHEAMAYRARGTPSGEFLARQMERLAQLIRWTGATTPEEHEARMEVWDDEVREQWFERGYHEGLDACWRQAARLDREDRD